MKIRTRIPAKVVAKPPQQPIQTTLQRHSISNSLPKKSEIKTQPKISNDQHYINKKNDYFFDHIISKLPIQSQYELTTNSYVQNKVSSHKNSCGCPVCRKPTQINLKIRPKLLKHHNLSLTPNKTIIFPSSTINKKITAKNSNSSTTQSASSNPQLIAQKTQPKIQGGFFKKVGKKAGGFFKKVGKKIVKGGKSILKGILSPYIHVFSKIKGIFDRINHFISKLPVRIGRLLLNIWKGAKSLKPWSLKWWKSLGKKSTWKEFLLWTGEHLLYWLEIAGTGETYETIMDWQKFNTRPLTSTEIAKAQTVFGNSINYNLVRVDERAILGPLLTDRAYVSFHTINSWGSLDDHTLIHELTHVLQYEKMGAIYMQKALRDQGKNQQGYIYGGVKELRKRRSNGQKFDSFNLEQQGDILGDYYIVKTTGYSSMIVELKDTNGDGKKDTVWEHYTTEHPTKKPKKPRPKNKYYYQYIPDLLELYEYFIADVRS